MNSGSFKRYWNQFQKEEKPLTRQNVADSVTDVFDNMNVMISAQFNGITDVAITADGLTGRRVSIWNVTARGFDKEWKLVRSSLGCFPVIAPTHDNATLAVRVKEILDKFGLNDEKIASVTTDEGSAAPLIAHNFLRAVEIHCGDHLLNTAQKNAIEQLNLDYALAALYFATVQEMSKHFNKSTAASEQLLSNQLATNEPARVIQRAVPTRFNSWLGPFKSIQSCKEAIRNFAYANPTAPFSDVILGHPINIWHFVDHIILVLDPFDTAIKILAAQDATLDMMVARYVLLVNDLEKAKTQYESVNSPLPQPVKRIFIALTNLLIANLEKKFTPFTNDELIAFVLNPFHCPRPEKDLWNSFVAAGLEKLKTAWQHEQQLLDQNFGEHVAVLGSSTYGADFALPNDAVPPNELDLFLELKPTTENALVWWKANYHRFPSLSRFAQKKLVGYPAQAESEREFSKLRNTITYLRNRLGHEKVFQLSVIRSKLKELYSPPPAARSEANIATDHIRVQSAAATRRAGLTTAYAAIPPNPPAPQGPEDGADEDIIEDVLDEIGTGELVGDEEYLPHDVEQAILRLEGDQGDFEPPINGMDVDVGPAPSTRANSPGKPKCTLSPVYKDIHQYIATFENLGEKGPPPYKNIFGHRSVHIQSIAEISSTRWHIIVTSTAKRKFPGVRNLMRELGEIIVIEDDMYSLSSGRN